MRALVLVLLVSFGTAGVCPAAAAARAEMACLTVDEEGAPTSRIERACCCVEIPDGAERRPPDTAGLRPGDDGAVAPARDVPATRAALGGDLVTRAAFRVWVPPPTLLLARTSFRC